MLANTSTIAEFQRRRKVTWHAIRWWLFAAVVALTSLCVLPFTKVSTQVDLHLDVGLVLVLTVVACLIAVKVQVQRLYRCPSCNKVPIRTYHGWANEFGDEARDVEWNPSECPNCQASLR